MTKKLIDIDIVVEDLKRIFSVSDENLDCRFNDGTFCINKNKFERYEVIDKLQEYFIDKNIAGGYCIVEPITFVFTVFKIEKGSPK